MNPLPTLRLIVLLATATASIAVGAELPKALNLPMPEGFTHNPGKPGLTVIGTLEQATGLVIQYEIGLIPKKGQVVMTGKFKNRAVQVGQSKDAVWFRQENVNGQPAYFAYDVKGVLHASFPLEGVNFRAVAPNPAAEQSVLAVLRTFGMGTDGDTPAFAPLSLPVGEKRAPITGQADSKAGTVSLVRT